MGKIRRQNHRILIKKRKRTLQRTENISKKHGWENERIQARRN